MLVVDTNIIVPLYVRTATSGTVRELRARDEVWRTDPFALVEFCNVLATYQRAQYLSEAAAQESLVQAETFLRPHFFSASHGAALELAMRHRVTAYDGRFLALADQLGSRLVTEDAKLRAAAPALTQSLDEALASV
ncbi:MAG: type II toxin-antitoxin system VapC family toxin [Chthoniobacterales bacterium]|nr:type II toxin-antitoxin system VapC family toxin [Chthoniobacterales bacterium]